MRRTLARVLGLLAVLTGPLLASSEVYHAIRTDFVTETYTARGYEVRARTTYAFPLEQVLDATHDHQHLSQRDPDIQQEHAWVAECTREACRINVSVLVGRFFAVGDVAYELDTRITRGPEEVVIEWEKAAGTRFVKHLHGELRLRATAGDGSTEVDYLIQVAAPRLSTEKLSDKAEGYLQRLGQVLRERHEGHESLWSLMEDAQGEEPAAVPEAPPD